MLNGDDTQILSIVGTGGLGKTTLAKLVYNNTQVKGCFELRIWICVSDPFDVDKVAIGIVTSVGTETIPPNTNQLALVLQKLEASVSGKKYLLVLDDVWTEEEDKWKDLKISLQRGAPGSKILVTTRNERVAKMMGTLNNDIYRPKELSDEECWSLLRDTSLPGKSKEECGKFEDVGNKIASKCKGLPLAAVVLGRLLQSKDLEGWKHVEKSEIWQLEKVEVEFFPHLLLSYNELSPTLKRCFSYCAIYPKDYRINAESLIEEWTALGYLGSVSGNCEVELKGRECLNNLAMRCLFQDIEESKWGEKIKWCKMHDIVHDFALFLRKNDEREEEAAEMKKTSCRVCDPLLVSQAQEYRSLVWDKESPLDRFDCLKSLRVLRYKRGPPPVGMEMLIHLRWLDFSGIALSKDGLKIICSLYFLQTLYLRRCSLEEIPREIGNLVYLRNLDLSRNNFSKEISESICSLVELQTLSLKRCSLKEIRREIGNLVYLRNLDLSGNRELKELPESLFSLVELQVLKIEGTSVQDHRLPEALGQLSNLRTLELSAHKVGSDYNKLGLLKKLNRLTASLQLDIYFSSMSEMVELVADARQAPLKMHFQKLEILEISFKGSMNEKERSSSSSMWMELLEALEPHHKLKELTIWRYKGSRLPHWMSSPLNFIKGIRLTKLSKVPSLPAMGKLPFLELLFIGAGFGQMKVVGR